MARFMESVTRSAYMITVPFTWRAARPVVWMSETAERRNPSLSASRMATSDTSGRSSPSMKEGLDLPEVSLVAILDADKEGFLRSAVSLIQTTGRAARHVNGSVIMYAESGDRLDAAGHRRDRPPAQDPAALQRGARDHATVGQRNITDLGRLNEADYVTIPIAAESGSGVLPEELPKIVAELERQMREAAAAIEFERAAELRDGSWRSRGWSWGCRRRRLG